MKNLTYSFVAFALLFASSTQSIAENWPQFRGLGGTASSADQDLPVKWSDTENIDWKVEIPGHGASSAVTWDDRIFLTSYSGYGINETEPGNRADLKLHVLCFSRASGELIWNKSHAASENERDFSRRIADHGYATGTPACDDSGVYALFGVSGVIAYDLQGKLKWKAEVGSNTAGFGSASSPTIHDNLVIVNASIESGKMYAFDKDSGEKVWTVDDIVRAWTTPTIAAAADGSLELIVNQKNSIYGFDPKTGEKLWTCTGIQDYVVPCVVAHDGIAYCIGGRSNRSIAVRLGGRGDVTKTHKLWEETIGANVTSPVISGAHLYWASDKGVACCLDLKTGGIAYRERLPTRSRIYGSVVLGDGKLYVPTRDQGIIVLAAKPEFQELARNQFSSDASLINASPAISNGQILIRTNNYLYCIGKR
ncbi:MAG: serine/threonine protein kinase [Planctomycetaceae bacterium]|nr:serine/threonine protein kinase [Planctomycetaceae bacterium]